MPLLNIPLQSHYIYDGFWTSKVDAVLIDTLLQHKNEYGLGLIQVFPSFFMSLASRAIHERCGVTINEPAISFRISLLAMRRQTFHDLIHAKGTYWDRSENFVHAADTVWAELIEKNPLYGAYYYHDEPEYYRMGTLFDMNDAANPHPQGWIEISSSSEEFPWSEEPHYMDLDVQEEVNSIAIPPVRNVRRKLFPESGVQPSDTGSTNVTRDVFGDVVPGGQGRARIAGPSHTNNIKDGATTLSPFASSCASNSPHVMPRDP